MIINISGTLRSAGQQLPNQEIILEAARTALEVISTTNYSIVTDQQGAYQQQIQTGTYIVYIKQNIQSTKRQVASNVLVLSSMEGYSINQILLEQQSIEIIDEDLLEQVLDAKNQQVQQAATATQQATTATSQSNTATQQATIATSQSNTATSQSNTATQQATTATQQASQAQQSATSAQQDAQSITGQVDQANTQQQNANTSQTQAQNSQQLQTSQQVDAVQQANSQQTDQAAQHQDQISQQDSATAQEQSQQSQLSSQTQAEQSSVQQGISQSSQQQDAQQQGTQQQTQATKAQEQQDSAQLQQTSSTQAQQQQTTQVDSSTQQSQSQQAQSTSQDQQNSSQISAQQDQDIQQQQAQAQQASSSTQSQDQSSQAASQSTQGQQQDSQSTSQTLQSTKQSEQSQSELKQKAWASQPQNEPVETSFSQFHFQKLQEYYAGQSIGSAVGQLIWRGGWSAQQGTYPPTPNDTQDFYRITAQGTIQGTFFQVADYIHWDVINLVWFKINTSDQVTSVNGLTGQVTLQYQDVGALGQSETQLKQYSLDTGATIALTGDVEQSQVLFNGANNISLTANLSTVVGLSQGDYTKVTVDTKGRVTQGSNPSTLQGYGILDATPVQHIGSGGDQHAVATSTEQGFMSSQDFSKLQNVENNQNNYIHPTSEGNKHVPQISQPYDIQKVLMVTDTGAQWRYIAQQDVTDLESDLALLVPKQTTINNYALTSNISLSYSDVGQAQQLDLENHIDIQQVDQHQIQNITGLSQQLQGKVDTTVQINGKALTQDITLTQQDLGIIESKVVQATFTYGPTTGYLDSMQETLADQSVRNTTYTYDVQGTLISSTAILGNITTTTTFTYDLQGNLTGLSVQEETI